MERVKVSSKGQVVIPKSIRESQHIVAGTELAITAVDGELRLKLLGRGGVTPLAEVAGVLRKKGRARLRPADEKRAIGRMLRRRDEATKR